MICAYIWPEYWLTLFIMGVLWECIEWIMKRILTPEGEELKFNRTQTKQGSIEYEVWWSSSSKDVLFNGLGILTGLLLTKM